MNALIKSFLAKYEPLAFTFVKVFVYTFVAAILAFWLGLTPLNVSGLWGAIKNDWDAAGGTGILAALVAVGFKVPAALKTKTV